ncbi:MAG: hypothetical protein QM784_27980 [Polyangiaceae bacterium]
MPTISRTQILRGPCQLIFNGGNPLYSKGDVTIEISTAVMGVETSGFGEVDQRALEAVHKVRFTPSGQFVLDSAQLYAPAALGIGASLFGPTDRTLVIKPFNTGQQVQTYKNAAITRMPPLTLSAGKTVFGEVEFTCLRSDATTWEAADSIVAASAYSAPAHTAFNSAGHLVEFWTAAWGSSPWNAFETEDGWTITPEMQVNQHRVDNAVLIDLSLRSLSVRAEAVPVDTGLTEAVLMTALGHQGAGRQRGQSLAALGSDLILVNAGGGHQITLSKAALVDGRMNYGGTQPRIGRCTWRATRTFTAGAANPLFSIVSA